MKMFAKLLIFGLTKALMLAFWYGLPRKLFLVLFGKRPLCVATLQHVG